MRIGLPWSPDAFVCLVAGRSGMQVSGGMACHDVVWELLQASVGMGGFCNSKKPLASHARLLFFLPVDRCPWNVRLFGMNRGSLGFWRRSVHFFLLRLFKLCAVGCPRRLRATPASRRPRAAESDIANGN